MLASQAQVNGAVRFGYGVPWYCEVDEEHWVNGQRDHLHYYEHTKRPPGVHNVTPRMVPNGQHWVIDVLKFGTQINEFRRAG